MTLEYLTLNQLRKTHPAWRVLIADHAPLIASFLDRVFIQPNVRVMSQADLVSKLEDSLYQLRENGDGDAFPRSGRAYLDDWAQNDKGWLRKFYPHGSDEPHYDLTPATEKALSWLDNLSERNFIGTESRLLMVFELLKQMVAGAETDKDARISELEKRKAVLDTEIARLRAGELHLMDDTALKDRFIQINSTARELLGDFRSVEQNFRELDRQVREQIATWDGRKGELLAKIFGDRDAIADSDQGRSFRAFWDFLMSPESQEELTDLLDKVFALNAVTELTPDRRLKRIHFDWLEAGEHTQRTVAKLSQQLRRYLDDQAYLENKRIMQLLDGIAARALAVKDDFPAGDFMTVDASAPSLQLPMERPLYNPPVKAAIHAEVMVADQVNINAQSLFDQVFIDKEQLQANIHKQLQQHSQVTLREVIAAHPLAEGLAELVAYLSIAGTDRHTVFDEVHQEQLQWQDKRGIVRNATLPRIIFNRSEHGSN
ncbi:MAG: DUF3375 domain-containing protein [Methylococcaceae bacterium]|nr:DUF3375 domain-containing protein [Methylococcaceae bacterium]